MNGVTLLPQKAAAEDSRSGLRLLSTTVAPASANPSASAFPSPRAEPVTRHVLSLKSNNLDGMLFFLETTFTDMQVWTFEDGRLKVKAEANPFHGKHEAVFDLWNLCDKFPVPFGVECAHRLLDQCIGLTDRRGESEPDQCNREERKGDAMSRPTPRFCGLRSDRQSSIDPPWRHQCRAQRNLYKPIENRLFRWRRPRHRSNVRIPLAPEASSYGLDPRTRLGCRVPGR
jgi:hypothetical protein